MNQNPDPTIREAFWQTDEQVLSGIRRVVFIVEQGVSPTVEQDIRDVECLHWLATTAAGLPVGTVRLLQDGQIGRMAVLKEYRQSGIGAALLARVVAKARQLGLPGVYLHAEARALGFYERGGFTATGEMFEEAGHPHLKMTRAFAATSAS